MSIMHLSLRSSLLGMLILTAGLACGQNYPNKPIRIITGAPGGGIDYTARMVAQGLTATFGQQVIVDNRGGGGGIMAGEMTAKAAPDGYTLMVYSNNIWLLPYLQNNVHFDPVKDFTPISQISSAPNTLVVNPSLPVTTVRELIAYAKANPGKLNFAHGGIGGSNHLAGELFKAMAGVNMVPVAYKSNPAAFTELMTNQVQLMFAVATSVAPHVTSGRLRAVAVSSAQRTDLAPGLPTIAESGVPGFEVAALFSVFAPPKIPAALLSRLNREIVAWVRRPEIKEKFFSAGADIVASSSQELAATMKVDMARWSKIIKDANIHGE